MKNAIIIIVLFFVLSALIPLANKLSKENTKSVKTEKANSNNLYNGLNDYSFSVKINTENKMLKVDQKIKWKNNSNIPLNEIYLSLPLNAFSNNETEFARNIQLNEENITRFNIKNLQVNGAPAKLEYIKTESGNNYDSTAAKIKLKGVLKPKDSLLLTFSYLVVIPKSKHNFGYAPGDNYFVFDNWYPTIAPLISDKWQINQMHSFSQPLNNPSNYSAEIVFPKDFHLISNAKTEIIKTGNKSVCKLYSVNITEFTFLLCKDFVPTNYKYIRKDRSEIIINLNLRESREKYLQRVINSVKNSIKYLENNIGKFPYDKLEIIDVSSSSNSASVSLPGLIRISIDLFSLKDFRKIEHELAFQISKQYFGNSLRVNENFDSWIVDGINSYVSDKIYNTYYKNPYAYFDFIYYYPVYGLNIFFYNEIPIIYTINGIQYPIEYKNFVQYYQNSTSLSMIDSTYKINNQTEKQIVSEIKPKLMFLTWERTFGRQKTISLLRDFYRMNQNNFVTRKSFDDYFSKKMNNGYSELTDIFYNDEIMDNRIRSLKQISKNKYEIRVEKNINASIPLEISVHTENGIQNLIWYDSKKVSSIIFISDAKVYAAEIDPKRKYISDINFSNNSYVVNEQYWGAFSIVLRTYFWIQNALLIMGSIG